jgi:hypothetical protein
MTRLSDKVRMLFDGKNFAVVSTLEPDGRPHSTVTWVKRDADDVLFALPRSRRKTANLIRDPRAAVVIFYSGRGSQRKRRTATPAPTTPQAASTARFRQSAPACWANGPVRASLNGRTGSQPETRLSSVEWIGR